MIRKLLPLFLVAGLTACASSGTQNASSDTTSSSSAGSASFTGTSAGGECDSQAVQQLVGKPYSQSLDRELQSKAGASQLRVLKPGQVMTLEYNPVRLNVIVEKDGSISALRCG
ncbi:I78 family peptidase inhibitor [Bordetella sp. 15P40C-2]|uniref:I78 family peptidase inhibitor n=1 Tax=Bordetella sp. 15P40C-2 TaxID=2572246 RepID=UPI001320945E|nr:I78 family peptidase inhibitor [Bordetella sp. 15P40C-2]MVW72057.1 hypothetical protein [Bordetella sp. 15P40C-2]